MTLKPCIGCGVPTDGSRCPDCRLVREPTGRPEHHLNGARWKNLSKRLRRMSPFCELCGATTNLTVDHIVRVKDRPDWIYELANLRVLCSKCNGQISGQSATPEQIAEIETKIKTRKRRRRNLGTIPGSTSAPVRRQAGRPTYTPGGYA